MQTKPRLRFNTLVFAFAMGLVFYSLASVLVADEFGAGSSGRPAVVLDGYQIDGDTLRLQSIQGVDVTGGGGADPELFVKLRLLGIDTPEGGKRATYPCPIMSRRATVLLWRILDRHRNGAGEIAITMHKVRHDRWGRILAEVRLHGSSKTLSHLMLEAGQPLGIVRPYFRGASATPWPRCY